MFLPLRDGTLMAVPLRCLIVDDSQRFLQTAGELLEREGITVVGAASTTADALTRARELRPDVVIVDLFLGSESGFDVARELTRDGIAGPTVILVSTHSEADFVDLIEASLAAGFVPKAELSAEAIRRLVH